MRDRTELGLNPNAVRHDVAAATLRSPQYVVVAAAARRRSGDSMTQGFRLIS